MFEMFIDIVLIVEKVVDGDMVVMEEVVFIICEKIVMMIVEE